MFVRKTTFWARNKSIETTSCEFFQKKLTSLFSHKLLVLSSMLLVNVSSLIDWHIWFKYFLQRRSNEEEIRWGQLNEYAPTPPKKVVLTLWNHNPSLQMRWVSYPGPSTHKVLDDWLIRYNTIKKFNHIATKIYLARPIPVLVYKRRKMSYTPATGIQDEVPV